jgi:hypothetical protein
MRRAAKSGKTKCKLLKILVPICTNTPKIYVSLITHIENNIKLILQDERFWITTDPANYMKPIIYIHWGNPTETDCAPSSADFPVPE